MPGRSNGGKERKTFQYFSESNDKENEVQKHFREKRIRETWLSYILATLNHGSGGGGGGGRIVLIQYVTLYSFYTWLSNP